MSQEFECLKLTMDGLFVSEGLLKLLEINRFALMATEEEFCTMTSSYHNFFPGRIEVGLLRFSPA